jgi:aminoglycoside phosphotransferase (APT) family kinase protein
MSNHSAVIQTIVRKELNEDVTAVTRMTTGLCNEVYSVQTPQRSFIIRLNIDGSKMIGSETHIPLLLSKGIIVPHIIASDYTKSSVPFAYQIQTKLDGQDIGQVISSLSTPQLVNIAKHVAEISKKLSTIPTTGKYGWIGGGGFLCDSWTCIMQKIINDIIERNNKTFVVGNFISIAQKIVEHFREYFENVPSVFYYDDMCTKNLLVYEGKFSGIVDLDTMAHGDPLEGIGRILASWFGTNYGKVYSDAVIEEMELNEKQKEMVIVYAVLNRIYWLSEHGIQWNENTSLVVDERAVEKDKKIINELVELLQDTCHLKFE